MINFLKPRESKCNCKTADATVHSLRCRMLLHIAHATFKYKDAYLYEVYTCLNSMQGFWHNYVQ